jgi:glycosyltransferase involved in cell wall biosynthesis
MDTTLVPHLPVEVSVVMPCLNEVLTVGKCIDKAIRSLTRLGVCCEVVVADNGSTDGSQDAARQHGAQVVQIARKGYGSALQGGIKIARGDFIIMGDADDSYDFEKLGPFIDRLRAGDDLVMGNRFKGGIRPGAMPWLHRYVGNPVLTGILNLFFRTPIGDAHCGLRGFRKDAVDRLGLVTTGMEFASEMVIKASLHKQKITEVPTTLDPDGRDRPPHLRSFRDGWRHLRFMLLMCPRWLFLFPAASMLTAGIAMMAWLTSGPQSIGGVVFDIHSLLLGCLCLILGYQTLWMWAFARLYAWSIGLMPENRNPTGIFQFLSLEGGLCLGGFVVISGVILNASLCMWWWDVHLGSLEIQYTMRLALWGSTLMIFGMQTIFGSFLLGMIRIQKTDDS